MSHTASQYVIYLAAQRSNQIALYSHKFYCFSHILVHTHANWVLIYLYVWTQCGYKEIPTVRTGKYISGSVANGGPGIKALLIHFGKLEVGRAYRWTAVLLLMLMTPVGSTGASMFTVDKAGSGEKVTASLPAGGTSTPGSRGQEPGCGEQAIASLGREYHTVHRVPDVVGQFVGRSDHLQGERVD